MAGHDSHAGDGGADHRRIGAVIKGLPPGLRSGAGKARSLACVLGTRLQMPAVGGV
jgi:hypothetical protein